MVVVQSTHVPPAAPQLVTESPGAHLPFKQQLSLHVPFPIPPQVEVQTPFSQVGVRPPQAKQAPPPVPQAAFDCGPTGIQVSL